MQRIGSGGPWEDAIGYSRVVRAGAHVWVSGCTSTGPDGSVLGVTAAEQTTIALEAVAGALASVGASLADVVRTRMFLTDISRWEEVGRAHGDVFSAIKPASTMVEVSGLVDPRLLIEIEVDAYVEG